MYQEQNSQKSGISLNRLLWALKRHTLVILSCLLCGLFLGYLFTALVPPRYKAGAQLLFDPATEQFTNSEPTPGIPSITTLKALERAIALIQSPRTLKEVAAALIHDSKKEAYGDTHIQRILRDTSGDESGRQRRLIMQMQRDLTIHTEAADQIIVTEYQSRNPKEAADIVNLIVQTFIDDRVATRKKALADATEWLNRRVGEAKDKFISIDRRIEEYKAEHKIENEGGSSSIDGQINRLREQLITVQAKLSDAENRYNEVEAYTGDKNPNYAKLAEIVNDLSIDKLRSSLADAEGKVAAAKTKFGNFHPEVQDKQAQVQIIKQEIELQTRRVILAAKGELDNLRSRERSLKDSIQVLEDKLQQIRGSEVQLRELQRERGAVKTLYEIMLTKLTQTAPQQTLAISEFKVLMDAVPPDRPKVNPLLIWFGGGVTGLLFGLGLSFLLDFFNDRLVHLEETENQLPVDVIARVPVIGDEDFTNTVEYPDSRSRYLTFAKHHPESLFTDCLLSAKLAMADVEGPNGGKVIMITSPMQGEGKTQISSSLATLSAMLGEKTLLVDVDFRKAARTATANGTVNGALDGGLHNGQPGHMMLASAEGQDFDVFRPAPAEGAVWLKFFKPQMGALLVSACENYDCVWIDTPPAQLFPDALILANQVDGVIIVAEWSKSSMKQIRETHELIVRSGGKVLGVIVNKVKVDRLISASMAYYKTYYGDAQKGSYSGLRNKFGFIAQASADAIARNVGVLQSRLL